VIFVAAAIADYDNSLAEMLFSVTLEKNHPAAGKFAEGSNMEFT
jgi:hypothetical protein